MKRKNHIKTLSLDVSSVSTGWSLFMGKVLKDFGTIKLSSSDHIHDRMVKFKDELSLLINDKRPDVVVIEDVWLGVNVSTSKTLSKFSGIAEETSYRIMKERPIIITNKEVKGFFKCKSKEDLYKFVIDILNLSTILDDYKKHNDITDSIAQAVYYIDNNLYDIRFDKEYGFLFII